MAKKNAAAPRAALPVIIPQEMLTRIDRLCEYFGDNRTSWLRRLIYKELRREEMRLAQEDEAYLKLFKQAG